MNPDSEPLSKAIYEKALSIGVTSISLMFQGGNDEGHLWVSSESKEKPEWDESMNDLSSPKYKEYHDFNNKISKFHEEVEDWAWTVYEYNGAGIGQEYGDTITYDLEKNTVKVDSWHDERVEEEGEENNLTLSED